MVNSYWTRPAAYYHQCPFGLLTGKVSPQTGGNIQPVSSLRLAPSWGMSSSRLTTTKDGGWGGLATDAARA